MKKDEIKVILNKNTAKLINWLENQDLENWEQGPEEKWTTGQQVQHLIQSMQALNKALGMPKFILTWKFGKANRPVRGYDVIVKKYLNKLKVQSNLISPFSKNMRHYSISERAKLINNLQNEHIKLLRHLDKWSDKHLDIYILPHPLMGRMPIREMIMWTAYHTEHHFNQLKDKY